MTKHDERLIEVVRILLIRKFGHIAAQPVFSAEIAGEIASEILDLINASGIVWLAPMEAPLTGAHYGSAWAHMRDAYLAETTAISTTKSPSDSFRP